MKTSHVLSRLIVWLSASIALAADGRPNILLVMVDDTGYPDLGLKSHGIVTLPEVLREAAYQIFMAGKWHPGKPAENWSHDEQ